LVTRPAVTGDLIVGQAHPGIREREAAALINRERRWNGDLVADNVDLRKYDDFRITGELL
jgi:hypothetical protein